MVEREYCPDQLAPKPVPMAAQMVEIYADAAGCVSCRTGGAEGLRYEPRIPQDRSATKEMLA